MNRYPHLPFPAPREPKRKPGPHATRHMWRGLPERASRLDLDALRDQPAREAAATKTATTSGRLRKLLKDMVKKFGTNGRSG